MPNRAKVWCSMVYINQYCMYVLKRSILYMMSMGVTNTWLQGDNCELKSYCKQIVTKTLYVINELMLEHGMKASH